MSERGDEFVCAECRRLIWRAIRQDTHGLCGECLFVPGWFGDPVLRDLLDPSYEAQREEREP